MKGLRNGSHMCGKTWNSEVWKAIAGELWKAVAGRASLLYVSLMQGREWKHQECKGSTTCCTQLATLHGTDTALTEVSMKPSHL